MPLKYKIGIEAMVNRVGGKRMPIVRRIIANTIRARLFTTYMSLFAIEKG